MGADIKGAGTDTIRIFGVDKLHGGSYAIIPDQIEAGTYMAAVAACGGQVLVRGIIPKHMDCITAKLQGQPLICIYDGKERFLSPGRCPPPGRGPGSFCSGPAARHRSSAI